MQLYRKLLLDHYHYPRNKVLFDRPMVSYTSQANACGDTVIMQAMIASNNIVISLAFGGSGCIVSQAIASQLTESLKGMSVEEIAALTKDFIINLIGMSLGPTRLKCAILPLKTLQSGLGAYQDKLRKDA